jgi:hypothetical protein
MSALFYLGTHQPHWLAQTDVPLFVSDVTLRQYKTLPRARGAWALDSGGFSELGMHGRWTVSAADYIARVRRYRDEVGGLRWAAIQDWMCEPFMIQKTGLSVREHQQRTVNSLLHLRGQAPDLPWAPVLQGWSLGEYLDCVELYEAHGVDLAREPIVGVGSVCRRQGTFGATQIMAHLAGMDLRLHGFGFKTQGLLVAADHLTSADSLAWSYAARRDRPLPGHNLPGPGRPKGHINCANCLEYALLWRDELLTKLGASPGMQLDLWADPSSGVDRVAS